MLTVEIWSDYACPFCYIGKRRLFEAIDKFEHRDQVEVVFRSYQLAPDAPRDSHMSMYENLAAKYNTSIEQAIESTSKPVEQAKDFGIEMNFDRVVLTNTMDAHRLTHYAATKQHKAAALAERLMKAYFTDGLHIGDHDVLVSLAVEVGLDKVEVQNLLASDDYADEVRQEREQGLQQGLKMIPHIMINGQYMYFGGQPSDTVLEALQNIWNEEETSSNTNNGALADGCTEDGCAI